MNYIKEINAFYIKIETNPLTASATALWHTLLHINNRAAWVKEFTVAAAVICFKSGLPLSTFKRARNELRDKGYITYTSRGTQAPVYEMVSLAEEKEPKMEEKVLEKHEGVKEEKTVPAPTQAPTNEQTVSTETYQFYKDNFGEPTKYVREELDKWARWLSDSHVKEALKRAVESGKVTWRYAQGILSNWEQDRLYTIVDVLDAEREFRKRRKGKAPAQPQQEEIIPDWFYEHQRKRRGAG